MASGDRSRRIRANVQRFLKNRGETQEEGLASAIFEAGDRIQRRIAEETLCLEGKDTLTVSGEFHDFPDGMVNERILIPDGGTKLVRINMEEVDKLKRGLANTDVAETTSGELFYYYKWNDQFGFLLSSGGAPTDSSEVTCYYWRYPDDISEKLSNTTDPVVAIRWDTSIFYGIVAELTGLPAWDAKFEREFERQRSREKVTHQEAFQIPVNREYD